MIQESKESRSSQVTYGSTLRAGVVEGAAVQDLVAFAQGRGGARGGGVGFAGGAGVGADRLGRVGGGGAFSDDAGGGERGERAGVFGRVSVSVLHLHGDVFDVGVDASGARRGREVRGGADAAVPDLFGQEIGRAAWRGR